VAPAPTRRVFDVEAASDATNHGTTAPDEVVERRRRGRWWPKVLGALVILAALGGGGLAVATAAKPSFPVENLEGLSLADARRLVADEEFTVSEIEGEFWDEEVPPGQILAQSPLAGDEVKQGGTIRVRLSDGPEPRDVPDLTGKTRGEAQAALDGLGLTLSPKDTFDPTIPKDVVVDWSPRDTRIPKGEAVTVTFSKGPEPVEVPSFLDKVYDEYQKVLEGLGIKVKKEEAFSDKVEEGKVISTSPATAVQPGSEVTVVVSKGPEQVAVPNLKGLSEDDAAARLQAAGLRLGDRFGPPKRPVFDSSPAAGAKVDKGSTVDVYTR
jgi:serine/threonine-protein kinase